MSTKDTLKNVGGKSKGFIAEFRDFAFKGNVFDMAIGVIIGAAFQGIINAVINDLINPIIGLLFKVDLTNAYLVLNPDDTWNAYVATNGQPALSTAKEAGYQIWAYGDFITVLINFILLALVVFLLVKGITAITNKAKNAVAKAEEEAAATVKVCPFCFEEIAIEATRCPHCTSVLPVEEAPQEASVTEPIQ